MNVGHEDAGDAGGGAKKKNVEPTDRVTRSSKPGGKQNRVPPTGDQRIRAEASSSRRTVEPTRGKPPSTRAALVAPASPPFNPLDRSGWTSWFSLCYNQFDTISCDEWQTILTLWTRVEGLARFHLGNVILGYQVTDDRPAALTQWVNIRRVKPIVIAPKELKKFAGDFWRWWVYVQPDWREVAGLDGPLTEEHRPDPAGRDWGELRLAKGRNGIASVIACLHWWGRHHTLTKGPHGLAKQWGEAVADVTYVLEGLLAAGWEA
ncbi:hypothetical protein BDZ89DRAFT_946200 [Hymenopellis radicata]|nr:hypothetical protein BDZ89DRAFT_946200 [Hymenopellis radicata]